MPTEPDRRPGPGADSGPTSESPRARRLAAGLTLLLALGPLALGAQEWKWEHPRPRGEWLASVWGMSPSDLLAVGAHGLILRQQGAAWIPEPTPTTSHLYGIWGSAPDRIFAVGASGTILRFDGATWIEMASPTTNDLFGVWGTATEAFAVGDLGTILRLVGGSWAPMPSGVLHWLTSVWGSGPGDVYAVGLGNVLHFDGTDWSTVTPFEFHNYIGVAGTGPDDVWVAGLDSSLFAALYHFDGSGWQRHSTQVPGYLYEVATTPAGRVFSTGPRSEIVEWTPSGIVYHPIELDGLRGIWADPSSESLFAVGPAGGMARFEAGRWTVDSPGPRSWLRGISGSDAGHVTAVGFDGTILERDGGWWTSADTGTSDNFYDVWAELPALRVAVGGGGIYTSAAYGDWEPDPFQPGVILRATWGSADDDVFAVGSSGSVFHFDGTGWSPQASGTAEDLHDVAGAASDAVFAVGDAGAALRFDGSDWELLATGVTEDLVGVWVLSPAEVFVVGAQGGAYRFDGANWAPFPAPSTSCWTAIGGTGASDVWMLSCGSLLTHFDGSSWSPLELPAWVGLHALWVSPGGEAWVAGETGAVLRSPALYEDGFETGGTARWSSSVP